MQIAELHKKAVWNRFREPMWRFTDFVDELFTSKNQERKSIASDICVRGMRFSRAGMILGS